MEGLLHHLLLGCLLQLPTQLEITDQLACGCEILKLRAKGLVGRPDKQLACLDRLSHQTLHKASAANHF